MTGKPRKFQDQIQTPPSEHVFLSRSFFWYTKSAARRSDRLYCLEDTLPETPLGLLLLNYATEFSNPKDGQSGKKANPISLSKFSSTTAT